MSVLDTLDKNMPILVIDEAATMRKVVKNCLKQLGFNNVTEVEDGAQVVETLQSVPFKFVISNWNLHGLNGPELLKRVRSHERLKTIPFLMVTPPTQKVDAAGSDGAGPAGFIAKPFTAQVLQSKMEVIFSEGGQG